MDTPQNNIEEEKDVQIVHPIMKNHFLIVSQNVYIAVPLYTIPLIDLVRNTKDKKN